jgi:hypothetical protein
MKKSLQKLFLLTLVLSGLNSMAQNQVYWREGFEPSGTPACDLSATNPTSITPTVTSVDYYFNGNAGIWYGHNVYRTTGNPCANAGAPHVRYRNIPGGDSGYLVTPIVSAGINEFHFYRARATRAYTLWVTNDTLATTTNWTPVAYLKSSASTVLCTDTTVIINSATAKRLKIVGRPGTDTDIDSIWITSVGVITPVTFGGISASVASNLVKLNFNIATETNTNSYIIERSANGDAFTEVGTLKANHSVNYSWMDNSPNIGNNFYRIKAVDNNGTFQYSTVVRINVGKVKGGLNVYPNPVKGGQLNVELVGINKGEYKARIYNMNGNLVHTATILSEGTSLSKLVTLPSAITVGHYTLEVTNGSFKTTKLISVQ